MFRKFTHWFVLLGYLALTACGAVTMPVDALTGEVYSLAPGTVAWGVNAALQSRAGTFILQSGDKFLFVWSYHGQSAAGFWAVNLNGSPADTASVLRGNLASSKSVSDLIASLRASGWTDVAPGAVPAAVAQLVGSRITNMPIAILAVGVFEGGFSPWFEDTFLPAEVEL